MSSRDAHMTSAMAAFMARILEMQPCMFVRSAHFLSWTGADAPVHDPSHPRCRSCGNATAQRRVLCVACRRNPIVVLGAPVIDTMFRSSNPLYAMDDEKRSVIVFLKNEQKRASDALALAEQLATWAYAVYKRMRRGGCGNVYYTRELVYGGGSWDAVVRCGLHKRTTFGGLGLMLQAEVERHAAEWLRVLDAHMREHFEIPLGHACTSDVSFTTCVNIFASLIAKRVALLEDTRSDPSQLLCSRGCEHLARLQFLRCEFMAQRCIVSDIECMRTLVRLARNGAPPADEEGVQALLALLKKPPPELLSLLPSVASDMAFAPLRDALGTGAAPAALAAWREEVQCESLCMLLERAIATVQGWRPPPSGFLNALRYDAAPHKHHLPDMTWVDEPSVACWSLLPRKVHDHRRVGLDPIGTRIVLMCSALMQIDAHEKPRFFTPGVARCDVVSRVSQREINAASHAHAHLREEMRPFTTGIEWETSRSELLNWNGSHLEEEVRRAAALLGGYAMRELRERFVEGSGRLLLLQPATAKLVYKPERGYETWCEASLELLLPILQQYRDSIGVADNVATHPDGEVLRLLPRVRDWVRGAGPLAITAGEAYDTPPLKVLLLRMERAGRARKKRAPGGTKMVFVLEPSELERVLL